MFRPDLGLDAGVSVLGIRAGRLVPADSVAGAPSIDLEGRVVLPGLVNGHDHLEFASLPPLGRPPYASVYDWADDVRAGQGDRANAGPGLRVPFLDRLFLGGLRNLMSGVTSVAHHGPDRRSFGWPLFELATWLRHGLWMRAPFPVRVLRRYGQAHSPGLAHDLTGARARTPTGAPFMLHAAEGRDERATSEIAALAERGLLDAHTLLVHALGASHADVARIRAADSAVIWCPESNQHLYGSSAPVAALLAAGVRLGLGSDSPASGVRDLLSTLAVARATGLLSDERLLRLATRDTALLLGLAAARLAPGEPADLLVVDDVLSLLRGERKALALVLVGGRALLADPQLAAPLLGPRAALRLEGRRLALHEGYARLLGRLLARHPELGALGWLRQVTLEAEA